MIRLIYINPMKNRRMLRTILDELPTLFQLYKIIIDNTSKNKNAGIRINEIDTILSTTL